MNIIRFGIASAGVVALASFACAQERSLVKLWETEATLKTPESVFYDAKAGVLYVTNIDGEPWGKDGRGSVAKVGLDGKVIAAEWVKGLHAPKGMGMHQRHLYVADMDRVAVIDVEKGTLAETIVIAGAKNLNDLAVAEDGVVYVTDSQTGVVFRLTDHKPEVWLKDLRGLNGVHVDQAGVHVMADNALQRVSADKTLTKIVDGLEGGADGIERVGANEFVVSCWRGTVYWVDAQKRQKKLLLDSAANNTQAADLGYNPGEGIVYVPTFFKNTVVAYTLK